MFFGLHVWSETVYDKNYQVADLILLDNDIGRRVNRKFAVPLTFASAIACWYKCNCTWSFFQQYTFLEHTQKVGVKVNLLKYFFSNYSNYEAVYRFVRSWCYVVEKQINFAVLSCKNWRDSIYYVIHKEETPISFKFYLYEVFPFI